ncbi:TonB-dependent receptor [Sphingopyxis italica]|uniref:TonB-dependent receptor n=1 Tax=Sphingopyxis italica TaxID=1129133 RepID=A0A7X5XNB9_9SPHN|nr:TonB-dependent receptor [Sphingopyxis italica]NJB88272.1 TonB-dependent receptor [Sphingopyxis italica]
MKMQTRFSAAVSVLALVASAPAWGQSTSANDTAATDSVADAAQEPEDAIVVTGVRRSLERAADIKRESVQVVDAIVAQDIGKLPDPTTAAALQRVPGVQVSVNRNNELGDVRVRGLPDVLTTVNGREVFSTIGRNFDLQDMPAEALSRVNVFKSQTADLTEGGLAGVIDLQLNRPFNFRDPTVVLGGRANYGDRVDKINPQFSLLATDRWDTGIGEIGALINGTYSKSDYYRASTVLFQRRSTNTGPFNTPGYVIPGILQNFPQQGSIERHQVNGALQWQASPSLEVYAEGFYTYFRDRGSRNGANIQPFTNGTTITDVTPGASCIDTYVRSNGNNPVIQTDAEGIESWTLTQAQLDNPVELCQPESMTFANLVSNQTTQARDLNQRNKQFAGGLKYEEGRLNAVLDVAYQTSKFELQNITSDIGQRLPSLTVTMDNGGHAEYTVPGDALLSRDNLYIRNALIQNFTENRGKLFQAKGDVDYDLDGFLSNIAVGVRYAHRSAEEQAVNLNKRIPGGNIGTDSEDRAVLVSDTGLPDDFLVLGSRAPDLNNGSRFYIPNPDFLLSEDGLDAARAYFGLPAGRPDYDPGRAFDAKEDTLAAYVQGKYETDLSNSITLDGVVGMRYIRTSRTIGTFVEAEGGEYDRLTADSVDHDWLPNATARFRIGDNIQIRFGYAKSLRRPNFEALNPAITLNQSNNPLVQSTGNAGNPDLKAQKSESLDATFEYYFPSGYVAIAGYYRDITDRVITSGAVEMIDGVDYSVARPRNVGQATLKGIELSTQYFLDFLPGALSGLGVQGAFTLADSKVGGDDPLAGYPLQGVSKYNYTVGLLYEKSGVNARLVYTYRSKYLALDATGQPTLRPMTEETIASLEVPALVTYARGAGRLDFNIGYDITDAIRVDIGGTNILGNNTSTYYDYPGYTNINNEMSYDETTYSVGVRVKF